MAGNSMRAPFDVVVLGGLNTDFTVRGSRLPRPGDTTEGESLTIGPGGKGANQAVAAARLGARVALIGRVGHDDRGADLVARLEAEGVDCAHVERDNTRSTGAALVQVGQRGQKQILTAPGANHAVSAEQVGGLEDLIRACPVFLAQLEVSLAAVETGLGIARAHRVRTVLDPAPPRSLGEKVLPLVDVLKPNAHEAEALTGIHIEDVTSAATAASSLLDRRAGAVVVEVPGKGNLLSTHKGEHWIPNFEVKAIDQTGAGDALAAALAVGASEGMPLPGSATFAAAAAALTTTAMGAQNGLQGRGAVDSLLRRSARGA